MYRALNSGNGVQVPGGARRKKGNMLRNIYGWLAGWHATLVIKYRHPGLYRQLCEPLDGADYGEVEPPR